MTDTVESAYHPATPDFVYASEVENCFMTVASLFPSSLIGTHWEIINS